MGWQDAPLAEAKQPAWMAAPLADESQHPLIDAAAKGAYAPFKPIVDNTLESLKNAAAATGEAMSEPMSGQNVPYGMQTLDMAVRGVGKVGNALGGAYGALTSPLQGALSAAAEPLIPAEARGIASVTGQNPNLTPQQVHQLAMQQGGDLSNAVMLGMGANAGQAKLRADQGLPPIEPPSNPLQPVVDAGKNLLSDQGGRRIPMAAAKEPMPEAASISGMYDQAGKYYDQADAAKAVIGNPKIQSIASDIRADLEKSNFDPDFHPETAKWLAKLEKLSVDKDGNPVDMPWSKVNGLRKLLNGVINDAMKKGGTEDGYQAITARNALDRGTSTIEAADLTGGNSAAIQLTRQGNTLWSAASKAEKIQNVLDKGENAAVPQTAYKNGFNKLANDESFMRSLASDAERDAVRHAAKTGIVTGALKNVGSRLMSGLVGTAAGTAIGGPLGAPVGFFAGEAAGYPFREAANAIQRGKGNDVISMIGRRPDVQSAMGTAQVPPPNPTGGMASIGIPAALAGGATALKLLTAPDASQPPDQPPAPPPQMQAPVAPQSNAVPLLDKIAQAESGGNPNAKNPKGSASGLLQFTDKTWADAVAKWGKELGITVKDKADPQAQMAIGQKLTDDNARILQKKLGRTPTDGEIYAAHFLGAADAARLISAQGSGKQAILLFPRRLIADNRSIFFDKSRPRTVEEVFNIINSKVA